jgi:hypothetical protein
MRAFPQLTANRYVQPLREGGSLPAIVDTDDGLYVVKFRGAGQGPKALVAELIVSALARLIGLATPDIAIVQLDAEFGRSEPDPEIQDLLRASHGTNVGVRFLDGAFNYDVTAAAEFVDPLFAAKVVWLDAFCTNVDRTYRNPNLLIWERRPWLIDHGAALYAHHNWDSLDGARTRTPFPLIEHHVLLRLSSAIEEADGSVCDVITAAALRDIADQLPAELLAPAGTPPDAVQAERDRYVSYLGARLESPRVFVAEAAAARTRVMNAPPQPLKARR